MSISRPVTRLGLFLLGAVAGGCGLFDAFAAGGLEAVTLTYVGDTVLTKDSTVPFGVVVTVGGAVVAQPRLAAVTSDSTTLALTASGDSLHALQLGRETLTVKLESSIFSDTAPTLRQVIRIRP